MTLDFFRKKRHHTSVVAPRKGCAVPFSSNRISQIVQGDLDPDFIEALSIAVPWAYMELYDRLAGNQSLSDNCRDDDFNRQRGNYAAGAISRVAQQHGVPYEYRRLNCNGQNKLLVKLGRVILIQEPVRTFGDRPQVAEYKRELADLHGFVRQLELDLRDQPLRIRDWSGCILAVLLHGSAGPRFTREQKMLDNIMLAIPDADYQQWIHRYDLQEIAMFGRRLEAVKHFDPMTSGQKDNVVVTPKNKNSVRDQA
jgi:hypothetical protein